MQEVCRFDDLGHGQTLSVRVSGRDIVLVRWENRVFALRNICPHQSRALTGGSVKPAIKLGGGFDQVEVELDRPVITCAWHGWIYDLTTGNCRTDGHVRVKAYPTEIVDGGVRVDV